MMRFTIVATGEDKKEVNVALNHDVHFVTAHPCVPSSHVNMLKTAMSPAFLPSPSSRSGDKEASTGMYRVIQLLLHALVIRCTDNLLTGINLGHPLHKAFTYTKIPLSTLLTTPLTTPFNTILSPPPSSSPTPSPTHSSTQHTTSSTIPKVLIIDCTDESMSFFPIVHRPSESASATASREASVLDLSSSSPSPRPSHQPSPISPLSNASSPLKYSSGNPDRAESEPEKPRESGKEGRKESQSDVANTVREKKAHKEYGSDLEMLGRALCAERGWDAVVSRRGRGCLACAVREVGSLGWRVVLRVA